MRINSFWKKSTYIMYIFQYPFSLIRFIHVIKWFAVQIMGLTKSWTQLPRKRKCVLLHLWHSPAWSCFTPGDKSWTRTGTETKESLVHIFWECNYVSNFCLSIGNFLKICCLMLPFNAKDIILGLTEHRVQSTIF